tara:strand:+ start:117 stop:1688 length:1572 start_codon:yes stop_codon:yes gene_type:complete
VAVVQISRIQHRSGISENLPQLARGELGLAVDTRQLYIGNGGSDAPTTENIEILTSRSDIIILADTYTYSDSQIGFTAQTGTSASIPIARSLQNKLDDFASVRDFGAIGDGTTDDTDAINRALYELFSREQEGRIRRALYFPGGNYKITNEIKIPTYAKLVGEGPDSTIIRSTDSTGPVAQVADSLQQINASVGSSSATRPSFITIEGMTFDADTDIDVFKVDQASNVHFNNVKFVGPNTSVPTAVGNAKSCVVLSSTAAYQTEFVTFRNCTFQGQSFCVLADNDMKSILFDGCMFNIAFKGFKLGENVTGSTPSIIGPKSMKVTGSVFDNIYNNAIHTYSTVTGFVSAYNIFKDCGNNGSGSGNAAHDVILFAGSGCYATGDSFDRPDADVTSTTRKVDHGTTNITTQDDELHVGSFIRRAQASITLDNSSTKSTGVTFADNGDYYAVEVDYYINRNSKHRQGKLRITHDATAQIIDDEFNENNGSVGVTFSLSNTSNITTLNYTTDNQTSGTLYLATRIIR